MNGITWLVRLARNLAIAATLIGAAQWLKGREPGYVVEFALFWGALAAVLFTGTQYWKRRRSQACAICESAPEKEKS